MAAFVTRFAPSPNGFLHLGHALSAILGHDMARRHGGRFLVRIEDIDRARCTPGFAQALLEDLAWLGLEWETPVRRQSEHLEDYAAALASLAARGLIYPSAATRGEIAEAVRREEARSGRRWPRDPDGAPRFPPPGLGGQAAPEGPAAWRLRVQPRTDLTWQETGAGPDGERGRVQARPELWGDAVLARRDLPTSYHLSVVVDDALQGVTHVVRGQDLFHATSLHRLLQTHLGLPAPVYHHHRLVLGPDGRKLSKSEAAQALRQLRAEGATPGDIRGMLGL